MPRRSSSLLWSLTLWWVRTRFPITQDHFPIAQDQYEIPIITNLLSPGFSRHPFIYQSEREGWSELVADCRRLGIELGSADSWPSVLTATLFWRIGNKLLKTSHSGILVLCSCTHTRFRCIHRQIHNWVSNIARECVAILSDLWQGTDEFHSTLSLWI